MIIGSTKWTGKTHSLMFKVLNEHMGEHYIHVLACQFLTITFIYILQPHLLINNLFSNIVTSEMMLIIAHHRNQLIFHIFCLLFCNRAEPTLYV